MTKGMSMSEEKTQSKQEPWSPPQGSRTHHSLRLAQQPVGYRAEADWTRLYKDDRPTAAMFSIAYLREDTEDASTRPLTFLFNGGPGAASAYLHLGAIGPKRITFTEDGAAPPPPVRLVDNLESWLPFSDLVFVDPIGTGFSRVLSQKGEKEATPEDEKKASEEFWEVKRDLESIGEFMRRFLTKHKRWTSPLYIAGESYGGFRVAWLAKTLQEEEGLGLNGALLISPAIELSSLIGSDYNFLAWCDMFPSMVATAHHHNKLSGDFRDSTLEEALAHAEAFVREELPVLLVQGESMEASRASALYAKMAALTGLSAADIAAAYGRIRMDFFCRNLLRQEGQVIAPHDGSLRCWDPFPDRDTQQGPDPALSMMTRVFASGINAQLRENLQVDTAQEYRLLNMQANTSWTDKTRKHFVENSVGAMDALRYGMALNPYMKVMVVHGFQDLVTPYFSSQRLSHRLALPAHLQDNFIIKNYHGGHMFYSWESSRQTFRDDAASFYKDSHNRS